MGCFWYFWDTFEKINPARYLNHSPSLEDLTAGSEAHPAASEALSDASDTRSTTSNPPPPSAAFKALPAASEAPFGALSRFFSNL